MEPDPEIKVSTILEAIKSTNYSKAIGLDLFDGKSILKDESSKQEYAHKLHDILNDG